MSAPGRGEGRRRFARLLEAAASTPETGERPTSVELGERLGIAESQVRAMREGDRSFAADRLWLLPGPVFRPLMERLLAAHPEAAVDADGRPDEAIAEAIGTMGLAQAGLAAILLRTSARDPALIAAQLSAVVRDARRVLAHLEAQRPSNDTGHSCRSKSG